MKPEIAKVGDRALIIGTSYYINGMIVDVLSNPFVTESTNSNGSINKAELHNQIDIKSWLKNHDFCVCPTRCLIPLRENFSEDEKNHSEKLIKKPLDILI